MGGHELPKVTDEDVVRIATEALASPWSVIRRLAGLPVRGAVAARVDAAIAKHMPAWSTEAAE